MYTYQDKVVLATANTTRYKSNLYDGYQSHELYEVLTIEVNNNQYEAIVLDVCGACYGVQGEQYQRYDIFTTGPVIGLQKGKIIMIESNSIRNDTNSYEGSESVVQTKKFK